MIMRMENIYKKCPMCKIRTIMRYLWGLQFEWQHANNLPFHFKLKWPLKGIRYQMTKLDTKKCSQFLGIDEQKSFILVYSTLLIEGQICLAIFWPCTKNEVSMKQSTHSHTKNYNSQPYCKIKSLKLKADLKNWWSMLYLNNTHHYLWQKIKMTVGWCFVSYALCFVLWW